MDPVDLTELMERTKNIEMILQEISTGRPYTVAVGMLVAQVLVLLVGGGFSWGAKEIWGAMKDQQAKRDEINQQLLLIPGEVKKTYEITVEEIKARSHSLDTILKEVRATQDAVSSIELGYESKRLMNERRYEFAVTTLTQLLEALYISMNNHKKLHTSAINQWKNDHPTMDEEFEVLDDEEKEALAESCKAQERLIIAMISRAPLIFAPPILEVLERYQDALLRQSLTPFQVYDGIHEYWLDYISIEEAAYTSLVENGRSILLLPPITSGSP